VVDAAKDRVVMDGPTEPETAAPPLDPAEGRAATAPRPEGDLRISHLKPAELVSLALQMRGRVDSEWQRVVGIHAALIAVMVFFANQPEPFMTARVIVHAFYTYNVIMLLRALRDAYAGLRDVTRDLMLLPPADLGGYSIAWLTRRKFEREVVVQSVLMVVVWLVVGYLLIGGLLLGHRPLHP
jgi:hypothetical protein